MKNSLTGRLGRSGREIYGSLCVWEMKEEELLYIVSKINFQQISLEIIQILNTFN